MSRSNWKLPYIDESIYRRLNKINKPNKSFDTIWSRRSTILPEFVGKRVKVHNGKGFTTVSVTENMIGHKFGEFSATRKLGTHKGK